MALAAHKLTRRLAFLILKLRLLALDPCQPGNGKEAYSLVIYAQGRGHPHPSGRWIDTKMKVLDVLANHINDKIIDGDLMLLSTHLDASRSLKFGSPGSNRAKC